MKLALDASNISSGGGLTHLRALLSEAEPAANGIERVVVWASSATLAHLPERRWLVKVTGPLLNGPLMTRVFWQQCILHRELKRHGCKALFSPGGTLPWQLPVPAIVMSRNMLPFEHDEARRFGTMSPMRAKMAVLRHAQERSLRRAAGVVFLSRYASRAITSRLGRLPGATTVIAHGVEERFRIMPRPQHPCGYYSDNRPFRFVYVSSVESYKHQIEVADAIGRLRSAGLPVAVDFIGSARPSPRAALERALRRADAPGSAIRWVGHIEHSELHVAYRDADAFVFASSCENLPNILVEAMAAGLPIACSRRGPMPEVLGEAGVYFDPESPMDIAGALRTLFTGPGLRERLASMAHHRARERSWESCARATFEFIARQSRGPKG